MLHALVLQTQQHLRSDLMGFAGLQRPDSIIREA